MGLISQFRILSHQVVPTDGSKSFHFTGSTFQSCLLQGVSTHLLASHELGRSQAHFYIDQVLGDSFPFPRLEVPNSKWNEPLALNHIKSRGKTLVHSLRAPQSQVGVSIPLAQLGITSAGVRRSMAPRLEQIQ